MEQKRTCSRICKQFRVTKPTGIGRYESGQCRCQTCDIWLDHKGCHLKDGSPAKDDSVGWFCNCCNFRVRRNPRNIEYKTKLRSTLKDKTQGSLDLTYFNKQRATIMKNLALCILKCGNDIRISDIENNLSNYYSMSISDIEYEFGDSIEEMINLGMVYAPPNKISMILEFEKIKEKLGVVPTREEFDKHSKIQSSQYESEFQSWEHMLERLGYDPWYRPEYKSSKSNHINSSQIDDQNTESIKPTETLENIRNTINETLKDEPEMLQLFVILEQNISKLSTDEIEKLVYYVDDD